MEINRHTLDNGLRLLHYLDASTQMVAVNVLYDVGARDEVPGHTGLAHLFEHLMFGGSEHIPDYDTPLQMAGGESNAWTSDDVTNFYDILPAHNVETAFWLESDRMNALALSQRNLDAQKSVVIEEFKQRCLNVPYGDVSHLVRPVAFTKHPYRWPVIGEKIADIEDVTLDVARQFFLSHYAPNNAIICVAGNISFHRAVELTEKWFAHIPRRAINHRNLPVEPQQTEPRSIVHHAESPQDLIVKAYHMCSRRHPDYHASDLISDILANGNSARFFQNVLLKTNLFSDLDASIWGSIDPGMLVIKGRLQPGVNFHDANDIINAELNRLVSEGVSQYEVDKFANKFESKECFENVSYAEIASKLCYHELIGSAHDINSELARYRCLTAADINRVAASIFAPENATRLYYGPSVH
ncbi:MAG: M16 family metallopeptidase [Muribaculaceae bacterium]